MLSKNSILQKNNSNINLENTKENISKNKIMSYNKKMIIK